jgi:hypothetical protein
VEPTLTNDDPTPPLCAPINTAPGQKKTVTKRSADRGQSRQPDAHGRADKAYDADPLIDNLAERESGTAISRFTASAIPSSAFSRLSTFAP